MRTRIAVGAAVLAVAVACALVVSSALGRGSQASRDPCFVADWSRAPADGDLTRRTAQAFTVLLEHAPDRLRLVRRSKLGASRVLKVTVLPGDHDENDSAQRAEVAAPQWKFGSGADFWLADSVYLPKGFPLPRPGRWALVGQLFGRTGGTSTGSPPVALEVTPNGHFRLTVRGGSKPTSSSEAPRDVQYPLGRASTGVWHQFLLHLHLEDDSGGGVDAWHRQAGQSFTDDPTASDRGNNVLTVGGRLQLVFPEFGYYRAADTRPGTLYTAGLALCPDRERAEGFLDG